MNSRRMMKVVEGNSISWDLVEFMDEVADVYDKALAHLNQVAYYAVLSATATLEWSQRQERKVVVPSNACYLDDLQYDDCYETGSQSYAISDFADALIEGLCK